MLKAEANAWDACVLESTVETTLPTCPASYWHTSLCYIHTGAPPCTGLSSSPSSIPYHLPIVHFAMPTRSARRTSISPSPHCTSPPESCNTNVRTPARKTPAPPEPDCTSRAALDACRRRATHGSRVWPADATSPAAAAPMPCPAALIPCTHRPNAAS